MREGAAAQASLPSPSYARSRPLSHSTHTRSHLLVLVAPRPADGVGQAAVAEGLVVQQEPSRRRDGRARRFEQVRPGGGRQGGAGQAEQFVDGHGVGRVCCVCACVCGARTHRLGVGRGRGRDAALSILSLRDRGSGRTSALATLFFFLPVSLPSRREARNPHAHTRLPSLSLTSPAPRARAISSAQPPASSTGTHDTQPTMVATAAALGGPTTARGRVRVSVGGGARRRKRAPARAQQAQGRAPAAACGIPASEPLAAAAPPLLRSPVSTPGRRRRPRLSHALFSLTHTRTLQDSASATRALEARRASTQSAGPR